ncbi:OLC1v1030865C1 [Oldenlandia corymbosa var. corymbosa]|uniref:OLC1v1030865C1 n=1 Tax=Oldenlandia corymbosa var. corymbosa TaxID=529605 RepID=A0AAV1CIU7_OLDCO|nr:OLC1v1030865C1 [Oldenlandia corymbosa var. corymbosa]
MEVELEPRVKPLAFKVKSISRESPTQKATHVLDADLRNHWSTGTNTKEWILLELDEPCLLSHVRIYNKSVLEWEVSVGLRYKPETFLKVRPRCEAPRRDILYPMNYSPCRYVRISCLRGNPIAIFFIQLIGISVTGLEPEFQPVVNYLVPHIMSHKQEGYDMHLQLLQDMTNRLVTFLPQLETDLNNFAEAPEPTLRFLAMLAGPFYQILRIVNEREVVKVAGSLSDSEASKNSNLSMAFTVSSNFEPRKQRSASMSSSSSSSFLVFRPDIILTLLRMAYKDPILGKVCKMVSRILLVLTDGVEHEPTMSHVTSDEASKSEPCSSHSLFDYSMLFGEDFLTPDIHLETNYMNILDIGLVEEGLLHLLYACASQPVLCNKLADNVSDFWLALPLVQALLPALRPYISSSDQIDDSFSQWKQPFIQHALYQIVATSSSSVYRPLLRAFAGYLASFSNSHAKAATVLIDLCCSVLAPWMALIVAKVDLAVELVEDLFGEIQGARVSFARARAALKYIVLALSGRMDDVMTKFKDAKHQVLFLVEMLEPSLDPAMTPVKSVISFGNVSSMFLEKQELNCAIALDVIRAAVNKPAVLPSLEAEWRRGSVAPSVLLSVLDPQIQLPLDIDQRKYPVGELQESQKVIMSSSSRIGGTFSKSTTPDDTDGKMDIVDLTGKMDVSEDSSFLFAPSELTKFSLTTVSSCFEGKKSDSDSGNREQINVKIQSADFGTSNNTLAAEFSDLQADYLQLMNHGDSELRASEFRRFAIDLLSQSPLTPEAHSAGIDALLLGAECFVNPYFMMPFWGTSLPMNKESAIGSSVNYTITDVRGILEKKDSELKVLEDLERKRDRAVIDLLLEAAELDRKFRETELDPELAGSYTEVNEEVGNLSKDEIISADAITLVRHNQARLCKFLVQRLQSEEHPMHEILIQSLLFLLHSATNLDCPPENIVDIILRYADTFNALLKSLYFQFKEGNLQLSHCKLHGIQRRWLLLQKLIVASSGIDEEANVSVNFHNGFRFANLVPPSAWLKRISAFSSSTSPLVRYLGWMAVSRNAKQYIKEHLFLASDLSQLTSLLSFFSDELAMIGHNVDQKAESKTGELKDRVSNELPSASSCHYVNQSFHALHPEISQFFPNLKKEFEAFGESILEAVGLQLRSLSSVVVPDLMCWFSDLCSWPFIGKEKDLLYSQKNPDHLKGFVAKNAKAVILFVLESILSEHMEAIVPELPRMLQALTSLCSSSYCDVAFLGSILNLLKPVISHSLHNVSKEENLLSDSCLNLESLCFHELLHGIKQSGNDLGPLDKRHNRALAIFVLASLFPDLSFQYKIEILHSSLIFADFASFELRASLHDYLYAYQTLMESCKKVFIGTLKVFGVIPLKTYPSTIDESLYHSSQSYSGFLDDVLNLSPSVEVPSELESKDVGTVQVNGNGFLSNNADIMKFSEVFDCLFHKLSPTIDQCYKIHHKLVNKLAQTSSECYVYSKNLSSLAGKAVTQSGCEKETIIPTSSLRWSVDDWNISLQELVEVILVLDEKRCWNVASVMLDCLLGVPQCFHLGTVIDKICLAIKQFSCRAPHIEWRLQTDKWIPLLFKRAIHFDPNSESPLVDLFCSMLKHPEPEQRFIALKQLRKLMVDDVDGGLASLSSTPITGGASDLNVSSSVPILATLVSITWDQVACMASLDTSHVLRTHALVLLMNYIPFAERKKLQSFLAAADIFLQGLANLAQSACEGPMAKFSLALIANICLHCPTEDIYLIPEIVWKNIETIGKLENGRCPMGLERRTCEALCRLRADEDEAKQMLRELLTSTTSKQPDPNFASTRESIRQVMANFTSAQSYFDFFSKEINKNELEFEEAEIELELLQEENAIAEPLSGVKDLLRHPFVDVEAKDDNRLQQIKDGIRSLEKTKLKMEIIARRQQKLQLRGARQKVLEEAAIREAELLQELDRFCLLLTDHGIFFSVGLYILDAGNIIRERTSEVEREIERQRLLELERAKTRELQHSLDMEREKLTQRELQRELEQVESGARPSRREFSSSSHSRPRYRERENGRAGNEGSLRGITGSAQTETAATSPSMTTVPKVVLSGGRQFSGQVPTILQSQDRSDETGSVYEENFDGTKDSGDTGSAGDPDLISALEGQSAGYGSSLRHGSRGGKSRQSMERRERDSRREGKWERKH